MRSGEARRFLEIHHDAVRGIAAKDYPAAVIDAWAPLPITDQAVERLRACYVAPAAARRGVGAALVAEIERIARVHGLADLRLESSLTATPFYAALGYIAVKPGALFIAPGVPMTTLEMRKLLA